MSFKPGDIVRFLGDETGLTYRVVMMNDGYAVGTYELSAVDRGMNLDWIPDHVLELAPAGREHGDILQEKDSVSFVFVYKKNGQDVLTDNISFFFSEDKVPGWEQYDPEDFDGPLAKVGKILVD